MKSASITLQDDGYFLSYMDIYGKTRADICKSLPAAKALFSRCVINPKYHGPNLWQEER